MDQVEREREVGHEFGAGDQEEQQYDTGTGERERSRTRSAIVFLAVNVL